MKVKVFIHDGIVSGVLADGDVNVEIIDINESYRDYEQLREYEDELYSDSSLKEQSFTTADFEDEDEDDN